MRVIITGATGMVGEGVLHACLTHPDVERILVVGRKSCGVVHPRLTEVVHADFFDLSLIEGALSGFDTCFFCLGVSSVGMKEPEFTRLTYDLTMNFARTLSKLNSGMTFCYISGAGTDSTEKGRTMWARVKGRTENDLMKLPFKKVYNFRPGFMRPTPGLKNAVKYYKYVNWLFPLLRFAFPGFVSTLDELAYAMIRAASKGYDKSVVEVKDIVAMNN